MLRTNPRRNPSRNSRTQLPTQTLWLMEVVIIVMVVVVVVVRAKMVMKWARTSFRLSVLEP